MANGGSYRSDTARRDGAKPRRLIGAFLLSVMLAACGGGGGGGKPASKEIKLGSLRLSNVELSSTSPYAGEPTTLTFDLVETAANPAPSQQIDLYLQAAERKLTTGNLVIGGIGVSQPEPLPIVSQTQVFAKTTTTLEPDSDNLRASVEGLFRISSAANGVYDLVAETDEGRAVLASGLTVSPPDSPDLWVAPTTSIANHNLGLPERPEEVAHPHLQPSHVYLSLVAANTGVPFPGPLEAKFTLDVGGKEYPLKVMQKNLYNLPQINDRGVILDLSQDGIKGFLANLYLGTDAFAALGAVTEESTLAIHVYLDPDNKWPGKDSEHKHGVRHVQYFPRRTAMAAGEATLAVGQAALAAGAAAASASTPVCPTQCSTNDDCQIAGCSAVKGCENNSSGSATDVCQCPAGSILDSGYCELYNAGKTNPSAYWPYGVSVGSFGMGIFLDAANNGIPSSTSYEAVQFGTYWIPWGVNSQNQVDAGLYVDFGVDAPKQYPLFDAQASLVFQPEQNAADPGADGLYCDFSAPTSDTQQPQNRYCFFVKITGNDLFPPKSAPLEKTWDYQLQYSKAASKDFPPIRLAILPPITLDIAVGFDGSMGLQGNVHLGFSPQGDNFTASVSDLGPFAKANGNFSASLDVVIASFGVEGSIVLLDTSLPFAAELQAFKPTQWATFDANLPFNLSVLDGSVDAFVKVIGIKTTMDLADWQGFDNTWQVFKFDKFIGSTLNTYDSLVNNPSFATFSDIGVIDPNNDGSCSEYHWDSAHNRLCATGCPNADGNATICTQFANQNDIPTEIHGGTPPTYTNYSKFSYACGTWWTSCFLNFGTPSTDSDYVDSTQCLTGGTVSGSTNGKDNYGVYTYQSSKCHDPQDCFGNNGSNSNTCYDCGCSDPAPPSQPLYPGTWGNYCLFNSSYVVGNSLGFGTTYDSSTGTLSALCVPNSSSDTAYWITGQCQGVPFANPGGGTMYQDPKNISFNYNGGDNFECDYTGGGAIQVCNNAFLWAEGCADAPNGSIGDYCPYSLLIRDPDPSCGSNCRDTLCTSCYTNTVGPGEPTLDQCIDYQRGTSQSIGVCGGQLEPEACGCGGGNPGPTPACLAQYDMKLLDPKSVDGYYTQVVDYNGAGPSDLNYDPSHITNENIYTTEATYPREIFWLDPNATFFDPSNCTGLGSPNACCTGAGTGSCTPVPGVDWGSGQVGWRGGFNFAPGAYDFHLVNSRVTLTPLGSAANCGDVKASSATSTVFQSPRCTTQPSSGFIAETIELFTVPDPAPGSSQTAIEYCVTVQPLSCPCTPASGSSSCTPDSTVKYPTRAYWVAHDGWTGLFFPDKSRNQPPICGKGFGSDDLSVLMDDSNVPCNSMGSIDENSFYATFTRRFPDAPNVTYLATVAVQQPNAQGVTSGGYAYVCSGDSSGDTSKCNQSCDPGKCTPNPYLVAVPDATRCSAAPCPDTQVSVVYDFEPLSTVPSGNYAQLDADVAPYNAFLVDYEVFLDSQSTRTSKFEGLFPYPWVDIWSPVYLFADAKNYDPATQVENASAMCIKSARARGYLSMADTGGADWQYKQFNLAAANMHATATVDGNLAGDIFPLPPAEDPAGNLTNPLPDDTWEPSAYAANLPPYYGYQTKPYTGNPFPNITQMGAYYTRETPFTALVPLQYYPGTTETANLVEVTWDDVYTDQAGNQSDTCLLNAEKLPVSARKPMRFRIPEAPQNNVLGVYFKNNTDLDQFLGLVPTGCCQNGSECTADVDESQCPIAEGAVFVHGGVCTGGGSGTPGCVPNPAPALLYSSLNQLQIDNPITYNNGFAPFPSYAVCDSSQEYTVQLDPLQAEWSCEESFGGPTSLGWGSGSVLDTTAPSLVQGVGVVVRTADQDPQPEALFVYGVSDGGVNVSVDSVVYAYNELDTSGPAKLLNDGTYVLVAMRPPAGSPIPTPTVPPGQPTPTPVPTGSAADVLPGAPVVGTGPNVLNVQVALRRSTLTPGSGTPVPEPLSDTNYYAGFSAATSGQANPELTNAYFAVVFVDSSGKVVENLVGPAVLFSTWTTSNATTSSVVATLTVTLAQVTEALDDATGACQLYLVTSLPVGDSTYDLCFCGSGTSPCACTGDQTNQCLDVDIQASAAAPGNQLEIEGCVNGQCTTASLGSELELPNTATYSATSGLFIRVLNGNDPQGCFSDLSELEHALPLDVNITMSTALNANGCAAPTPTATPPLPSGSWCSASSCTCQVVSWDGKTLCANCDDGAGGLIFSCATTSQGCSSFANVSGYLTGCGYPLPTPTPPPPSTSTPTLPPLPGGNWNATCPIYSWNGTTLCANCPDGNGNLITSCASNCNTLNNTGGYLTGCGITAPTATPTPASCCCACTGLCTAGVTGDCSQCGSACQTMGQSLIAAYPNVGCETGCATPTPTP